VRLKKTSKITKSNRPQQFCFPGAVDGDVGIGDLEHSAAWSFQE